MPIFKTKNENFFKKWSSEMAYVLGFFCADGSMTQNKRGACFIEFQITDEDLLEKIKTVLGSNHKITARKRDPKFKTSYRLQIGSKAIFNDLINLGIVPQKSKILKFPKIPKKYLSDFVRGYFDGDGNVVVSQYNRKNRKSHKGRTMFAGFTSGSKNFLVGLQKCLQKHAFLGKGSLYFASKGHRLYYSVNDTKKLYSFMYRKLKSDLFLIRKKRIFELY